MSCCFGTVESELRRTREGSRVQLWERRGDIKGCGARGAGLRADCCVL